MHTKLLRTSLPGFAPFIPFRRAVLVALVIASGQAAAATYTLPGSLPSGCTTSSATAVSCSSLSLAWADTILVSNANLTLTVTNGLTFGGNNSINASSTVSGFKINAKTVSATNNITLRGDISATNALTLSSNTNNIVGNIVAGGSTSVGGSITGTVTSSGSFSSGFATTVSGAVAATDISSGGGSTFGAGLSASTGDVLAGSSDRISGDVSAVTGKVTLSSSVTVGGKVNAKNEILIGSSATVSGSVTSTNDKVTLSSSGSSVGGGITAKKEVTIGSGCTVTGDIATDDTVILQSSNSRVNGNILAKKKVELGSSTTVTGNVTSTIDDVELLSSASSVNSCITVASNKAITLNWGTSAGGVCCLSGSTCSNSCVSNNSGGAMPALCQASSPCISDLFASGTLDSTFWTVSGVGFTPQVVTTPTVASNRLRLTDNAGNRATFAQVKRWFPGANNRVVVEFDYFAWAGSGNGGDGIAVVFSDASVSPSTGGYGGSIGYANRTGSDGFGGGWLGIGLDEFGNFPGTGEGRRGYPTGYTPPAGANATAAARANSVAVRGSGSGQSSGYVLLANSGTLATSIKTGTTATDSTTKHRYRITLDHSNSVNSWVTVERDTTGAGTSYATVIPAFDVKATSSGQAAVPTNLLLSFTAGTGGATNNHEISNIKICATKIDPVGVAAPASNFECMDDFLSQASYNNRQITPSSRNPIYTKLARTAFKLRVVPLDAGGAIKSDYIPAGGSSKDVTVELFDDSASPRPACNAYSGTPVATQTATLVSGVMTTGTFTVNKAYTKLMCRVTDNTIPASPVQGCSSDQFAVRPGAITLTPSPVMASGPSASATPTLKAGGSFTLRATSSTSASDLYAGTLAQNASAFTAQSTVQDTVQASGGVVGVLSPATLVANAAATPATYSEAGYLYLAAGAYIDTTFTAVDGSTDCVSGSTSATLSGGKYGCVIGNTAAITLGRFVPDRFTVTAGTPVAACTVHPAAGAGYTPADFTYFSQTDGFSTPFTLTAVNVAGSTTLNYTGAFVRLGGSGWTWTNTSSATGLRFGTSAALPAGAILAVAKTGGVDVTPTGSWANGSVALANVRHQITRPTALTGETAVTVTALPVDADGVSTASATAVSSATAMRFGRLRAINTYGSEKLALAVPLQAQYFDAAFGGFKTNKDDSCTVLSLPAARTLGTSPPADGLVSRNFYPVVVGGNQLASADTTVSIGSFSGGVSSINLTAPGKSGWTDMILGVPGYLTGNWGNCWGQTGTAGLSDDLPCVRATFGVYKSALIYSRENY